MKKRKKRGQSPFFGIAIIAVVISLGHRLEAVEPPPGYSAIQRAFLREDFEAVSTLARPFLADSPELAEAHRVRVWLALALARLEHTSDALRELETLKSGLDARDPLWPELLYWEGDISRRALKMVRAKLAYQQLLDQHPDSTWATPALLGLGFVAMHHQAFEEVLSDVRQIMARQPPPAVAQEAAMLKGLALLRLRRFADAVAVFQELATQRQEPELAAQATFHLGEGLTGVGRYDEAIEAYRRVRAAAPDSSWETLAWFGEGWACYRAGRCEESLAALERYLAQAPSAHQAEALFAEGGCFLHAGNDPKALAAFRQILVRTPRDPLALESGLAMVGIYRRREEPVAAKELVHALLRWPLPDTARAQLQLHLGRLALDEGNTAQAITVFRLAEETPDPAIRQTALNGLGDAQLFLGEVASATPLYEEAVALVEGSREAAYATYQLGRIALRQGAPEAAIAAFQGLLTHDDEALADDARLALVAAHLGQGQADRARTMIEAIRRERPLSRAAARAAYYQALLAMEEGRVPEAERWCLETIAQAPRSDEALEARLVVADIRLREGSPGDVMTWLEQGLRMGALPIVHQATLAKRLGDLARGERQLAHAIRWYELAEERLPSRGGEFAYRIASCYEEGGDAELAIQRYRLIEPLPWRVRGRMAAAKLLERDGRRTDAEALLAPLAREPIPEAEAIAEQLTAWHETAED